MASDIWLRTILIVRKETRRRHIGYSYRLTARVLLYAPSRRQLNTYHGLCYTSRGALAGTRNSSMGISKEGNLVLKMFKGSTTSYPFEISPQPPHPHPHSTINIHLLPPYLCIICILLCCFITIKLHLPASDTQ